MERFYLKNLIDWYNSDSRKPLLVYGAHQIGKTTLIRDIFGVKYFKNVIYVDFKEEKNVRVYVKNHINPQEIIAYLEITKNKTIDKDTLIIFDEVQECLPCLTSLKYFAQDFKELFVIATGDLVRTKLKLSKKENDKEIILNDGSNNFMSPIGKIDILEMYPLSFNEYLYNRNKKLYEYLKDQFDKKAVLDDHFHSLAKQYIFEYFSIGGMPEIVNTFLETGSFQKAKNQMASLFATYLDDMTLYQMSNETLLRCRKVFNKVYSQLNKENRNFKISELEKDKRNRDYEYSILWLKYAHIIFQSYLVKEIIKLPLRKENDSLYRIYMSDIGMLAYESGINYETFINPNRENELTGPFIENFVALELSFRNIPLYYWKGKTTSELEFVLNVDNKVVVIDAKKNKGSMASLEKFREHNQKNLAIKVSMNKYGYDEEKELLTLPFYYLGFYLDEIKDKVDTFKED